MVVSLPASLARVAGQRRVPVEGATLRELLEYLVEHSSVPRSSIFSSNSALQPHVVVAVNDVDCRELNGLETRIVSSDDVRLITAVAGG